MTWYPRPRARLQRAAVKSPAYSLEKPPLDWPEALKAVYMLAAAPRSTMEKLCHIYEREFRKGDSLAGLSDWALGFTSECQELRRWINQNEGKLHAYSPDALSAFN